MYVIDDEFVAFVGRIADLNVEWRFAPTHKTVDVWITAFADPGIVFFYVCFLFHFC